MRRRIDNRGPTPGRRPGMAAAIGAALLLAGAAGSATAADAQKLSPADTTFLKEASQSNRFEIASSEVAVQFGKGSTKSKPAQALEATAAMIAADHRKAQARLGALEKRFSIQVPNRPDPLQQFLVSQLAALASSRGTTVIGAGAKAGPDEGGNNGNGANGRYAPTPSPSNTNTIGSLRAFYLRMQVATHQLAIARFSEVAGSTRNAAIRKYACGSLPMLENHLRAVEKVLGSAPGSSSGGSGTSTTSSSAAGSTSTAPGGLPRACSNG